MPNWCGNELVVTGPAEDLRRFKGKAVGHSPWLTPEELATAEPDLLNFHSLAPIPDEIIRAGYNDAGYDWERERWGCKWGACETHLAEDPNSLIYRFDTAWVPPLQFIETVARAWPSLTFELDYEEGNIGFKGHAAARGETLEDQRIET